MMEQLTQTRKADDDFRSDVVIGDSDTQNRTVMPFQVVISHVFGVAKDTVRARVAIKKVASSADDCKFTPLCWLARLVCRVGFGVRHRFLSRKEGTR